MANLATQADVLKVLYGRTTGIDVSGSDIDDAIVDAQNEVFGDYGDSVHGRFDFLSTRTVYEFRPNRLETHEIKVVFVNNPGVSPDNTINRNEIPSGSYTADLTVNKLTFTAAQVAGWNGSFGEVDYIPKSWHLLTKNKAALNLLDTTAAQINAGEGEVESPRITRIAKRIRRLEKSLAPKVATGSFENINHDERDRDSLSQRRFNKN